MISIIAEFRYAVRTLAKTPAFTALAVVTLALGFGVNTAMFTIVDGLLLRPLAVTAPQQLVVLASRDHHFELPHGVSYPDFRDYRGLTQIFSHMSAVAHAFGNLSSGEQAERVVVGAVSADYFPMLDVRAALGRTFLPEEDGKPGAHPVLVMNYGCWKRRFGGDPALVGKTMTLNGHPFTIVGVLPESFPGTNSLFTVEVYTPMAMLSQVVLQGAATEGRSDHSFWVMGRLKADVGIDRARSAVSLLAGQLEREYPATNKDVKIMVVPEVRARPEVATSGFVYPAASVFTALVGLVLLIACANVTNLLLARATGRQREMAIRAALGASRWVLTRQLMIESVVLAALGGVAGTVLGMWSLDLLNTLPRLTDAPLAIRFALDWRVVLFTFMLGTLAGLVTGLAPALRSSRPDVNDDLKDGARGSSSGGSRNRLRSLLVVAQVAVSMLLLVCSGLFFQSLRNASNVDLGYRTEKRLMLSADPGLAGYDEKRGLEFYRRWRDEVKTLPGVRSATLARFVPFSRTGVSVMAEVLLPEQADRKEAAIAALDNFVGPDYFQTMGIPILRGREFSSQDSAKTQRVVVINQALSERLWPGKDPIGRHLLVGGADALVAGVAKNGMYIILGEAPRPLLYQPLEQAYSPSMTLIAETAGDPLSLAPAARQVVRQLDEKLVAYGVTTLDQHIQTGVALLPARVAAALTAAFGALGLLLAVSGIYGVVSCSVSQRTHEIGIRMALGARASDVLKQVVGQGLVLCLWGGGAGVLASLGAAQLFSTLLYGVNTANPATYVAVFLLVSSVGAAASYLPARRAAHLDPLTALRHE